MIRSVAAAAVLAAGLSCAGTASAQTYLADWGVADMKSAVVASGASVVREDVSADGAPYIAAMTAGGMKFSISGRVCDHAAGATTGPKRCRGASVQTRFTLTSDVAVDAAVKKYAPEFAAVSISNSGKSELLISRYVILDHGVHRDNLKLNISVFTGIAERVWAEV